MRTGKMNLRRMLIILPAACLLFSAPGCEKEGVKFGRHIDVKYRKVESAEDIVPLKGGEVEPLIYTDLIDTGKLPPGEREGKFIELMLPSVLIVNRYLNEIRSEVHRIALKRDNRIDLEDEEEKFIKKNMAAYRADDLEQLERRLYVHPASIVLAQAALESGWGSSRFFVEGNNAFGIWSFDDNDSRLKTSESRSGRSIYLKKYDSLPESILDYYKVIARGPYKRFRDLRIINADPLYLIRYLINYSELREDYVRKLRSVIRYAGLEEYDSYVIDPDYIK